MLKPCKIVTRGTATGLFFDALPSLASRRTNYAWHDAIRHRGGSARVFAARRFACHDIPDLRFVTAEQAALYVRAVGVDRIVEALVQAARLQRDFYYSTNALKPEHALYGVPPEVIPLACNGHVLADNLLSLGHWIAEPYALWISRPKGTSRAKWQRAAALKFVQALPVPADMYAIRYEPDASTVVQTPNTTALSRVVRRMLLHGTRDALLLAHTVEDAMQELYGCTFRFTLHAFSDTEWGVSIGQDHTFRVYAPATGDISFAVNRALDDLVPERVERRVAIDNLLNARVEIGLHPGRGELP